MSNKNQKSEISVLFQFFAALLISIFLIVGVNSQSQKLNRTSRQLRQTFSASCTNVLDICNGPNHITCNNPMGNWNFTNCPCNEFNRTLLKIGNAERNQILFLHNMFRNNIALGNNPRFPKAARMAEMVSF